MIYVAPPRGALPMALPRLAAPLAAFTAFTPHSITRLALIVVGLPAAPAAPFREPQFSRVCDDAKRRHRRRLSLAVSSTKSRRGAC